jgi:Ca2+-binding RTX toxin-like protein
MRGRATTVPVVRIVRPIAILFLSIGLIASIMAAPSRAAVVCQLTGSTVSITLDTDGDAVFIRRDPEGTAIEYGSDGETFSQCDSATVANTDLVGITDTGSGTGTFVTIMDGASFAPGATDEGVGSSEIEFDLSLGDGPDSATFVGSEQDDSYAAGAASKVNLNSDSDDDAIASGADQVVLQGSGGDDVLSGLMSDVGVYLYGGAGDDHLVPSPQADVIHGEDGGLVGDTLDYSNSNVGVNVDLGLGQGSGGHAAGDTITNITFVDGTDFNDQLTGDGNANVLNGGLGADTLSGGDTGDVLSGGPGGDSFDGGPNIEFDGDIVDYGDSPAGVSVNLATGTASGGDAAGDSFVSGSIESLRGSAGIDNLTGDVDFNILWGGAGGDTLSGEEGFDSLIGEAGGDTLDGGDEGGVFDGDTAEYTNSPAGITVNLASGFAGGGDAQGDTLVAGTIELVSGSSFDDILTGDADANGLTGSAGNDNLSGGANDDSLSGGPGGDTMNAGEGGETIGDTATYIGSSSGVTVDLSVGATSGGDASGDMLILGSFENIQGSNSGDVLTGEGGPNRINSRRGTDTITGLGGDDLINPGRDADSIDAGDTGETAGDTLAYNDSTGTGGGPVTVNLAANTLSGGFAAGDVLTSGTIENVTGSPGVDSLTGDGGPNVIDGRQAGDNLDGGTGLDTLNYSISSSLVVVDLDADTATGGFATGDVLTGGSFENATGSAFDDFLNGDGGPNVLSGGEGGDTMWGRAGADSLDGGAGTDLLSYENSPVGVTVDLGSDSTSGGDATGDVLVAGTFEDVRGSDQADSLTGDDSPNLLVGTGGNDTLVPGAGADVIDGGDFGETTGDTLSYATSAQGVSIDLALSTAEGGDAAGDVLGAGSLEHVIGSSADDELFGDDSSNTLTGGGGADTLEGAGAGDNLDGGTGTNTLSFASSPAGVTVNLGASTATGGDAADDVIAADSFESVIGGGAGDTLIGTAQANSISGGAGADLIRGSGAADVLDGGVGNDNVDYTGSSAAVTVNLAASTAAGGHAQGDQLGTGSFEDVTGSGFNDKLSGSSVANVLTGGAGDDVLTPRGGADTLQPGEVNEVKGDTLSYAGSPAGVTVNLGAGFVTGGDSEGDTIPAGEFENVLGSSFIDILTGDSSRNTLTGGSGNDKLAGGNGTNVLSGGGGADKLTGGSGKDTLNGGPGKDVYTAGGGADRVLMKDRIPETANGGAGKDCVTRDKSDKVRSFEKSPC